MMIGVCKSPLVVKNTIIFALIHPFLTHYST